MIVNKNKDDDSVFGNVFGNAFGNVFSDEDDKKDEEVVKTPKNKGKAKKVAEVVKVNRTNSRTFSINIDTENKKEEEKKNEETNPWFENASKFYEKKHQTDVEETIIAKENTKIIEPEIKKVTATHSYSPSIFKSKIITKEEKKQLEKEQAEKEKKDKLDKKQIEERGIAFAKTFINKDNNTKFKPRENTDRRPTTRPITSATINTRPAFVKYVKKPKIKRPPTLKTRVSGKSNSNDKTLKTLEGFDIRAKNPVVIIMGHVDHGKSTLLDYIRKANTADREVGGITQKMSAYEITHSDQKITFLDTPGHESFTSMRVNGASAADIAILIVSAEDGVKPQTLDALKAIQDTKLPFFVGISKIDKNGADIEKTKQSLAEHGIFVEGYGGDISYVPFSGKTGKGIDDLLDMILLMSEVNDIKAAYDVPAECVIIESGRDKIRGIYANMLVKNGTLKVGSFIVTGGEISPVRIMENFEGKTQKSFEPGQPVKLMGWSNVPKTGDIAIMCQDKETAELLSIDQKKMIELENEINKDDKDKESINKIPQNIRILYGLEKDNTWILPIVLKTDSYGTLEAVKQEIGKIKLNNINIKIIRAETGDINENDIKLAQGSKDSIILGYNTKIDNLAKNLANQLKLTVNTFDIIYKLSEWLEEEAKNRSPKITEEEEHGSLKVLKVFNANKSKQVLGGRVVSGKINLGDKIKILRRDNEIGQGEIVELQQARSQVKTVEAEYECGLMIESKIEIAIGDAISAYSIVEK